MRSFVYILSNSDNTVLYIGVTSNIAKRIVEHKTHIFEGFTDIYNCDRLVYFEEFQAIGEAIQREKTLKAWRRKWKYDLIRTMNPKMVDLWL